MNRSSISSLLVFLAITILVLPWVTSSAQGSIPANSGQDAISGKPEVYSVMAYNDKVDTYGDEFRLDAVLKTIHGAFDPNCAALGAVSISASRGCNLSFVYQFNGASRPDYFRRIRYLNTLGSKEGDDSRGAVAWARNVGEYFTVHKIVESGPYDYLVISIEADLDYADTDTDPSWYSTGGKAQQFEIYAVMDEPAFPITCNVGSSSYIWNYFSNSCDRFFSDSQNPDRVTNIMEHVGERGNKRFMSNCLNKGGNRYCSGPVAFVGWDSTPRLWSGGQANWGLVTDYGLNGGPGGVAPPDSFFVYWFNVANGKGSTSNPTCVKNSSFWFQWVALKDNSWVPVDDLTPEPVLVTGQSNSVVDSSGAAAGQVNTWASFNDRPSGSKTNSLYVTDKSGKPMPAQGEDGSIDFAKAKRDQGLDGYFKLVTWPITTDAGGQPCTVKGDAHNDVFNPDPGISDTNGDANLIQQRLNTGWNVDTVFYKYDIPRPPSPSITEADGRKVSAESSPVYVSSLSPTISGTCLPSSSPDKPNIVTLFGEDPEKPISTANPNDVDTRGYELGRAECVPVADNDISKGGRWSIEDGNSSYPGSGKNTDRGTRRYHAWMTEHTSGYDMTSSFLNIVKVVFASGQDPSPVITNLDVPHTRRDEDRGSTGLPAGSEVRISGTIHPSYVIKPNDPDSRDSTLRLTAKPSGGPGLNADPVELAKTNPGTFIIDQSDSSKGGFGRSQNGFSLAPKQGSPGTWTWSVAVDPTVFTKNMSGPSDSETYTFEAVLTNPAGVDSVHGSLKGLVDMTPSDPGIVRSDWQQVSGRANVSGFPKFADKNASVSVVWPNGSSSETKSDKSTGLWSIKTPGGLSRGNIQVTMTDTQGNESQRYTVLLDIAPPTPALPFTGGALCFLGLVLAILLLTLTVALLRWKRMHTQGLAG